MDDVEHDPTEEERSEAEALVRALERGSAGSDLPEDALETASLLQYSRDGGELDADRQRAIWSALASSAKPAPAKKASSLRWLAWLVPALGVAAAGLVVGVFTMQQAAPGSPVAAPGAELPAPTRQLLGAQASAAAGDDVAAARLSSEMRAHRARLLAVLRTRYAAEHSERTLPLSTALALGPALTGWSTAGCAAQDDVVLGRAEGWVHGVGDAHERAAAAIDSGDYDAAARLLREAVERPVPPQIAADHGRVVRQDLFFALADLALTMNEPEEAVDRADAGLSLGRHEDLYTANLLVVRGRALVASGRDVEAASDYYEALEINDALLRRTLDGGE